MENRGSLRSHKHFQGISDTLIPSRKEAFMHLIIETFQPHPLIEVGAYEVFTPKCDTYTLTR